MTTHDEDEHIVTAEEPAWTEQRFRPSENGTPEAIPDTMAIFPLNNGPLPRYTCSCGAEFRDWAQVQKHYEEVERGRIIHTTDLRRPNHSRRV